MRMHDSSFVRGLGDVSTVAAKAIILLPLSSLFIWWAYSMRLNVAGRAYSFHQAVILTVAMSAITTGLTAIVWIVSLFFHKRRPWLRLALKTTSETAVILILFVVVVSAWRQSWTPAKGLSDEAAFMPVVGHVNAAFFSDYLWLEYLVVVIPLVSITSGLLTSGFDFFQRHRR